MYLTDREQEDLLEGSELLHQEEIDQRRWSAQMVSTVRADDGKIYRISWSRGLTENQEHEFYSGDVPEVFAVESLKVKSQTLYLTEDEQEERRPTLSHRMGDDAASFAIATGKELSSPITEDLYNAVAELRETIHELAPLDIAGGSGDYREATKQYLDAIMALWEGGIR